MLKLKVLERRPEEMPQVQARHRMAFREVASRTLRRVILPETFRSTLPALVAMYITMFQFTTLAAFIGCSELLNTVFTAGNASYRYLELYTVLAAIYLVVLLPSIYASRRLDCTF